EQPQGRARRIGVALEPREELEVLARREPTVQSRALWHPADARTGSPLDRALARRQRAREEREQRRLPGAVRADNRDDVALAHLEIGRAEGEPVAEGASRSSGREERRHRSA